MGNKKEVIYGIFFQFLYIKDIICVQISGEGYFVERRVVRYFEIVKNKMLWMNFLYLRELYFNNLNYFLRFCQVNINYFWYLQQEDSQM